MKIKSWVAVTLMLLCAMTAFSQGKITGKIIDKKGQSSIPYASVTIYKPSDTSLVNGSLTLDNGTFVIEKVPYGSYLLRVSFMGYTPYQHTTIVRISPSSPTFNLGTVALTPSAATLSAVEVTAERSLVDYQLDKRVINVDKNIVSGGGTASDILENVPSVAIDNDGNVTLRGSTNVKILIDGRPYEMMGNDLATLLEQIPASTIENVEVVTNPSAKYDPEGMSGIINLKLKDRAQGALGFNGVANLNFGAPLPFNIPSNLPQFIPTTMGSLNLNYSTEKWNLTFSADGGLRSRANYSNNYIERKRSNIPYSIDSLWESSQNANNMGSVKIGAEYFFNPKNSLLFSYQYRKGNRVRMSDVDAVDAFADDQWMDYSQSDSSGSTHGTHVWNLNYTKKFDQKDRLLTFDASYSARSHSDEGNQLVEYNNPLLWQMDQMRNSYLDNTNKTANFQLNYVHPFSERTRLEAGYEGRMTFTDQNYKYFISSNDSLDSWGQPMFDSVSSLHYKYQQHIHAVYLTFSQQLGDNLSAQVGLRGEYSNIGGEDISHTSSSPVDKTYWQLYPTVHLSYKINEEQSLQLSYSRRVRRPNMWSLNPYLDVEEGQEMSFGNPGLDPEFTNAFELSYNFGFHHTNIFTSAYFRQTNNMMTRYGFVWDEASVDRYADWMIYNSEYDGYWASTWQNLNQGTNYGVELIVDQQIAKWWKINASVNMYESSIEGTELLDNTDRNAFRVSGKLSSFMTLPHSWTIQLSGQYRAPFMDLQTDMMASYWADLAIKKDVFQNKGSFNLRVSDVFCTGGFGHTTDTDQLYRVFRVKRISPTITIGFSYKINNGLKQKASKVEENNSENEYGEM